MSLAPDPQSKGSLREQSMPQADGFMLVCDLCSRDSFEALTDFRAEIGRYHDLNRIPTLLVGNKSDLEGERRVERGVLEGLAARWAVPHLETSAKTRTNIEEAFNTLARAIRTLRNPNWRLEPTSRCTVL